MSFVLARRAGAVPFAAGTLAMFILCSGQSVSAAGDIKIDETNFPDNEFRAQISESVDADKNGVLSEEEINSTTYFTISDKPVADLKGIEFFTKMQYLSVDNGSLTSLDVSKNTELISLNCTGNNLTSLNVSGCSVLDNLTVNNNPISQLDLSGNPKLRSLACENCKFESLDLSHNPELWDLCCDSNSISKLDLAANPKLYVLSCYNNKLQSLDLSGKADLFRVECARNQLTEVNLTGDTTLNSFNADTNKLKSISFTANTDLVYAYLSNNELSSVDVSANTKLKHLDLEHNKLSSVDTSGCTELEDLFISDNDLASIDISKNRHLELLWCSDNKLTELTIDQPNISGVVCDNNKLKSIAIKSHGRWSYLSCCYNELTKLKVPTAVDSLCCYGNKIGELDISDNDILKNVYSNGTFTVRKTSKGADYYAYNHVRVVIDDDSGEEEYYHEDLEIDPLTKINNGKSGLMKLDKNSVTVICGKTVSLKGTFVEAASGITWTSSDTKVATVDKNGKVTAKMAGAVTISAEKNGKKAGCKVTVLYKDVTNKKDFWYTPTNELTAMGIVKGYDNQTKFKPANECTRAQMLTFIWRLKESPKPSSDECKFPDVKKSDYFYNPVIWAVDNGITTGYSDGTFKPQNVCTRAQTVTYLWRMAGKPAPSVAENKFSDVKESDYFYEPVLWASEVGIVAGYKDGTFKPQGKCLRRQMVTFLYKYDKFVNAGSSDS